MHIFKLLSKHTLLPAGMAVMLMAGTAAPADAADHGTRSMRQEILQACTAEAQTRKLEGSAQRQFVDDCVKTRVQASPQQVEQMKTTMCQRQATYNKMQGHNRQHFVEDCVKTDVDMTQHHEKVLRCSIRATQERMWGDKRKKYVDDCIGS
jgi:hypothetical protein